MPPEGNLTPAQYEIMEVVWSCGRQGASVSEIWERISAQRSLARTTILNLVDRLEKRGWLRKQECEGVNRFRATLSQKKTSSLLTGHFVDDFFGGSPDKLVLSLLGNRSLSEEEINRIQALLDAKRHKSQRGKEA